MITETTRLGVAVLVSLSVIACQVDVPVSPVVVPAVRTASKSADARDAFDEQGDDPQQQTVWLHYDYMVWPQGAVVPGCVVYRPGINCVLPAGYSTAPDPVQIDLVIAAFAAHDIKLKIDPHHTEIPGATTIIPDGPFARGGGQQECFGPDAVSFAALKAQYFHPTPVTKPWHYAIFGYYLKYWDGARAAGCGFPQIGPGSSGQGVLPGFDFIVTLGKFNLLGLDPSVHSGAAFMHELGHNLGLVHGGCPVETAVCREFLPQFGPDVEFDFKPNYFSVMNLLFLSQGIPYGAAAGSTDIIGRRLDYSETPSMVLDENDLDETIGINAGTTDITVNGWPYWKQGVCGNGAGLFSYIPASGPADFDCDGKIETHASAFMLNASLSAIVRSVSPPYPILAAGNDWAYIHSQLTLPLASREAKEPRIVDESSQESVAPEGERRQIRPSGWAPSYVRNP